MLEKLSEQMRYQIKKEIPHLKAQLEIIQKSIAEFESDFSGKSKKDLVCQIENLNKNIGRLDVQMRVVKVWFEDMI